MNLNARLQSIANNDVAVITYASENYRFQYTLGLRRA
jgi:hypothetical protein